MLGLYLALIDTPEEQSKFVVLYEKYRKLMHYVAMDILHNDSIAEEAVQEAFMRIAKNFHKVGDVDSKETKNFVAVIAKNVAKSMLKKENKYADEGFLNFEDTLNVQDMIFSKVRNIELISRILQLPETQRNVIYLYGIYGYSYREIANLLGRTEASVRKQMQRARESLNDIK